jgi:hypothetical protein
MAVLRAISIRLYALLTRSVFQSSQYLVALLPVVWFRSGASAVSDNAGFLLFGWPRIASVMALGNLSCSSRRTHRRDAYGAVAAPAGPFPPKSIVSLVSD